MIPRDVHHKAGFLLLEDADCPAAWALFRRAVRVARASADPGGLGPVARCMWDEAEAEAARWEEWAAASAPEPRSARGSLGGGLPGEKPPSQ